MSDNPIAAQLLEFRGELMHNAQARMRLLDGSEHSQPVICMDIVLDSATHNLMRVEQPFDQESFDQAKAAAHRLKKGMHVTVQVPVFDLRLTALNAAHIHVIPDQPQEQTAP